MQNYYRTWDSHHPPHVPVDEVEYADAEPWDALYLATWESGLLRRFDQINFERYPLRRVALASPRSPGSWIYVRPDPQGEVTYSPSLEVPFAATEGLARFGRATVSADGMHADLYRVERTTPFVDEYTYRPDGTLSAATVTWDDGTIQRYRYDAQGKLCAVE